MRGPYGRAQLEGAGRASEPRVSVDEVYSLKGKIETIKPLKRS